ncbi:hypothetical protein AB0G74_27335 [Streptomyces sp. NPDC020875]
MSLPPRRPRDSGPRPEAAETTHVPPGGELRLPPAPEPQPAPVPGDH